MPRKTLQFEAGDSFELPAVGGRALPRRVFTETFYDTAGGRLGLAGFVLRRRIENGKGVWRLSVVCDGRPDARRRDARRPRRPSGGAARARLGCLRGLRARSGAARADARDRAARQGGKQVAREDQRRLDRAPRRAADDRLVQRDRARAARRDPEGARAARVGSSQVRRQAHERRRALGAGSGPRAAARAAAAFDVARAAAPVPPGAVRTDARPRSGRSGREGPRGPASDARRNAAPALGAEDGCADPRPGLGGRHPERARLARPGSSARRGTSTS